MSVGMFLALIFIIILICIGLVSGLFVIVASKINRYDEVLSEQHNIDNKSN